MNPPPVREKAATPSITDSRFRGAMAASLDAFFLCESVRGKGAGAPIVDFRVVELNERAEQFVGKPRAEVLGALACDVLPSIRENGVLDQLIHCVETGDSFEDEIRVRTESGEDHWIRYQAVRVEDGVAITTRDITRRKQVQESLLQSEMRFKNLVESATDGIYRIDPRGVFIYANPVASRLLGFSPDEAGVIGRNYLDFVRPDYHMQGMALYRKQIVEQVPLTYWEFPAIALDGRQLWIGQNVHIEVENGMVTSLVSVARDITERKKAELALKESEERYRFLADHSTDLISRQAPDGSILYASPVCYTLLGYDAELLIGKTVFECCHNDDLPALHAASARLLGHKGIELLTYRIRHAGGHYVWFETTSRAVRDVKTDEVTEILSVSRDVTERRRMEEELRQAQKMEAVGQLAGGVAHDFNNLLTAIRGFSDLLARSVESDDPRRKDIGEILKATERAAALTRQLLAFSKRQVLRLEPLNVNSVVGDMTKIIRRLLGENITVDTELDRDVWTVRADAGQLEQVLLNLALNARDAMVEGGKLTITTRNVEVATSGSPDAVLTAGRYVILEVRDTGAGMTAETRARVFEPFFTTKDPNSRSGLGLATVYGIITQTGGTITVDSSLGEGTTFTIHLPVAGKRKRRSGEGATVRSSKGNTILIAEDNEGVRALTVRLLQESGYRVFDAVDGVDALETLRSLEEPVDLLISDIMMPRMNGGELAEQFKREQPGTPILLMSGYMDEEAVRRMFAEHDAVLPKPFAAEALLDRVAELIGKPVK